MNLLNESKLTKSFDRITSNRYTSGIKYTQILEKLELELDKVEENQKMENFQQIRNYINNNLWKHDSMFDSFAKTMAEKFPEKNLEKNEDETFSQNCPENEKFSPVFGKKRKFDDVFGDEDAVPQNILPTKKFSIYNFVL